MHSYCRITNENIFYKIIYKKDIPQCSFNETTHNINSAWNCHRRKHRIIKDRIEKSINGRRIGHTGKRRRGLLYISTTVVMLTGLVLPWRTLRHLIPHTPGMGNRGGRRVLQMVQEIKTMQDSFFSILSFIILCAEVSFFACKALFFYLLTEHPENVTNYAFCIKGGSFFLSCFANFGKDRS